MASRTMETISRSGLQNLILSDSAHITNVKSVSSYSWIDTPTPTIAVPGSPSLWSPPVTDVQLPQDSGLYNIAENMVRMDPDSPLAPIFSAIFTTNPSFDFGSISVITDGNNIRKLLSFISPGSSRDTSEPFTIQLELARNTLLMCRHETAATEYIGPHEFRGYRHEFEKAFTTRQIDAESGDLRILSALIERIITLMTGCCGRGTLRYDVATASLIISANDGASNMLPEDLYYDVPVIMY
ncbi:hypothetical protein E4U09_005621 [Claviceps aff. purpurea]|uniref:Uncharacterized protein n=1 Tax=Claviceps aff. purpurea TaxID=1967640 RepID=A0A9P7QL00_9HYPO|nr:hypothetical protein E4U09_005621 [Claviceps aff. purpurea]